MRRLQNVFNWSDPDRRSLFFAWTLLLLVLGLLSQKEGLLHVRNSLFLFAGLGLITVGLVRLHPGNGIERSGKTRVPQHLWVAGMLMLYMGTGAAARNWFFMPQWSMDTKGILSSWLLRSLVLTLPLAVILLRRPACLKSRVFAFSALAVSLLCLYALGRETGFRPLYRVDHPSFQYRFASFLGSFPRPVFYDPHWNGGQPVPYLVASGVWSMALPWYPLLKLFSVEQLYTPMLATTFLGVVPLSGYAATRLFEGSRRAGWITFLLFLVPGQYFFTHVLHYGTAPSIFCVSLFPLILALLWKLLHADTLPQLARRSAALTLLSGLVLCWPGSLLPGLSLLLAALALYPLWTPRRLLWMALSAGALVLMLFPLALVPIRHSPIDSFLQPENIRSWRDIFVNGLAMLANQKQGLHPAIVVFGATVWFLDPVRLRRRMLGTFIFSAALFSGWGEEFQPLLQWERLIIPAAMTGAVAAGLGLDRLFSGAEDFQTRNPPPWLRAASATATAWVCVLLLLGGYQGYRIFSNRGPMDFHTLPSHTAELIHWLKGEVPEGGRVLIAGRAVHGFGGAKVAAMPLLIGREMISSDYYGFSTRLVEYQCPPREVLNHGPEGVFQYLDLYNVTHVMTYHQGWVDAFERHPEYYTPRYQNGRVQVYEVRRTPSMLLTGTGGVSADFKRIHLELPPGQEQVVLKYNWDRDLHVDPPAELFPVRQPFGIQLIGIRPRGLENLTLEYRP